MCTKSKSIVISGPSGSGKSTLIRRLFEKHPNKFEFIVSHTTRPIRENEVNGKHYFFVSTEEFERMIAQNKLIEYVKFGGNYYGTSSKALETAENKIGILDIEIEGVKFMRRFEINALYIVVFCPPKELESRLRKRGTETEETIQKRLSLAQEALDHIDSGLFDVPLENINEEETFSRLEQAILSFK